MICFWLFFCVLISSRIKTSQADKKYISLVSIPLQENIAPLRKLALAFLANGDRVSIATFENGRTWLEDVDGLEFISLGNSPIDTSHSIQTSVSQIGVYSNLHNLFKSYSSYQKAMYDALFEDYFEDRPDLVIVDRFSFAGVDVSHMLKIQYVINNPTLLLDLDDPPSYIPAPFSSIPLKNNSVYLRCMNVYYRLRFRLAMIELFRDINKARKNLGLPPFESKKQIYGRNLALINTVFGIEYSRPIPPLLQMVGHVFINEFRSVNKNIFDWAGNSNHDSIAGENSTSDIIYVNMGHTVTLSTKLTNIMITTILSLNYRVIWVVSSPRSKLQNEIVDFISNSFSKTRVYVSLSTGIDDMRIVSHVNVKAVLFSGDFHTCQEILLAGKPIVGIPLSVFQMEVVNRMAELNAGKFVNVLKVTPSLISATVYEVVNNPIYQRKSQYLGSLLRHATFSSNSDNLGYVSELVNLVSKLGNQPLVWVNHSLPFYKAYLLDVYVVFGSILCLVALVLKTGWSTVLFCLRFVLIEAEDPPAEQSVVDQAASGNIERVKLKAN